MAVSHFAIRHTSKISFVPRYPLFFFKYKSHLNAINLHDPTLFVFGCCWLVCLCVDQFRYLILNKFYLRDINFSHCLSPFFSQAFSDAVPKYREKRKSFDWLRHAEREKAKESRMTGNTTTEECATETETEAVSYFILGGTTDGEFLIFHFPP